MKKKLKHTTGVATELYRGEFEIFHPNCAFVGIAEYLNHDLRLEILNRKPEDSFSWVRFLVKNSLTVPQIQQMLEPWFNSNILKKTGVWCRGTTVFEILANDVALNSIQPIVKLPFGEIVDYVASSDDEHVAVLTPSSQETSGKDLLLKIEEKLKEAADHAELISFKKLTENEVLDSHRVSMEYPRQWHDLEEERILKTALIQGYFEIPKAITIEELAESLGMSKEALHSRLASINRQVRDRLLREWGIKKKVL